MPDHSSVSVTFTVDTGNFTRSYACIEDHLLSVAHRAELEIETEPEELVNDDWKEAFE